MCCYYRARVPATKEATEGGSAAARLASNQGVKLSATDVAAERHAPT